MHKKTLQGFTLVELIVMVVFVRLIPRLLPDDIDTANSRPQIL